MLVLKEVSGTLMLVVHKANRLGGKEAAEPGAPVFSIRVRKEGGGRIEEGSLCTIYKAVSDGLGLG
jgi:hypothetical protein